MGSQCLPALSVRRTRMKVGAAIRKRDVRESEASIPVDTGTAVWGLHPGWSRRRRRSALRCCGTPRGRTELHGSLACFCVLGGHLACCDRVGGAAEEAEIGPLRFGSDGCILILPRGTARVAGGARNGWRRHRGGTVRLE